MYEECLTRCVEVIKAEDACPEFCDFASHVYNHDPKIFTTFTQLYQQDTEVLVGVSTHRFFLNHIHSPIDW